MDVMGFFEPVNGITTTRTFQPGIQVQGAVLEGRMTLRQALGVVAVVPAQEREQNQSEIDSFWKGRDSVFG